MSDLARTNTDPADHEIVITRDINAPRELVFQAWGDPAQLAQWWGPRGFSTRTYEMDFSPGGVWRFRMRGADGVDYANWIRYTLLAPPEKIVYRHGETEDDPSSFETTVTFASTDAGTRVTMRSLFPNAAARAFAVEHHGAIEGGKQTLDRLDEWSLRLHNRQNSFSVSREYPIARDVVWRAWTDSEQLKRWFGPKGFAMWECKNDLRPGGMLHYGIRSPTGQEMWGKWVYRDVVAPDRLVFVASFSDVEGGITRHPLAPQWPLEVFSTVTLTERAGRTTVTIEGFAVNASAEEIKVFTDGFEGMRKGWGGTLDQLREHLTRG